MDTTTNFTTMNSKSKISNIQENNGELSFQITDINVSLINALRRTILSDIDTIVIRTTPYEKNDANFISNTSRFHNEMLKQRLSSIPIHIKDHSINLDDYIVECNVSNTTDTIIYVTTEHFKIKNITTNKYLSDADNKKIFPKDNITGDYIVFAKLRPKISDEIPGEKIHFQAKMTITNAAEDNTFNTVSTCSYGFTGDPIKQNEAWAIKQKELKDADIDDENILIEKQNWFLHQAKRYYKPDSFDFILKSLGVFTNTDIIHKANSIIIEKVTNIQNLAREQSLTINHSITSINSFDIILDNDDYTIGKSLEYSLHQNFYINNSIFNFIGFNKEHPHDKHSIIRVSFKDSSTDKNAIYGYIIEACDYLIKEFQNIDSYF